MYIESITNYNGSIIVLWHRNYSFTFIFKNIYIINIINYKLLVKNVFIDV